MITYNKDGIRDKLIPAATNSVKYLANTLAISENINSPTDFSYAGYLNTEIPALIYSIAYNMNLVNTALSDTLTEIEAAEAANEEALRKQQEWEAYKKEHPILAWLKEKNDILVSHWSGNIDAQMQYYGNVTNLLVGAGIKSIKALEGLVDGIILFSEMYYEDQNYENYRQYREYAQMVGVNTQELDREHDRQIESVRGGVIDIVSTTFIDDYFEAKYGDENSFYYKLNAMADEEFRRGSATYEIITGVGSLIPSVAASLLIPGSGAGAVITVLSALGGSTEQRWREILSGSLGDNWETNEIFASGMAYGYLNAMWQGAQYMVGEHMFFNGKVSLPASAGRIAINTGSAAVDTFILAFIDSSTSSKTFEQAFAERGGFEQVKDKALLAFLLSSFGEILKAASSSKNKTDPDVPAAVDDPLATESVADAKKRVMEELSGYTDDVDGLSSDIDLYLSRTRQKVRTEAINNAANDLYKSGMDWNAAVALVSSDPAKYGITDELIDQILIERLNASRTKFLYEANLDSGGAYTDPEVFYRDINNGSNNYLPEVYVESRRMAYESGASQPGKSRVASTYTNEKTIGFVARGTGGESIDDVLSGLSVGDSSEITVGSFGRPNDAQFVTAATESTATLQQLADSGTGEAADIMREVLGLPSEESTKLIEVVLEVDSSDLSFPDMSSGGANSQALSGGLPPVTLPDGTTVALFEGTIDSVKLNEMYQAGNIDALNGYNTTVIVRNPQTGVVESVGVISFDSSGIRITRLE